MKRVWLAVGLVLALAIAAPAFAQRLVAVGDLHGDYGAYRAIIEEAGLVNAAGKWTGGDAVFVQAGDVPDRGPDTLKILRHLMALEKQAKRKGGRVVALIGNHEAMNMTGDLRYVTPEEFEAFVTRRSGRLRDRYLRDNAAALAARYGLAVEDKDALKARFESEVPLGWLEHRLAWAKTGEIGRWVASHDAVFKWGDAVFVHGGVSDAYASRPIAAINAAMRAALNGEGDKSILDDEVGPVWYRGNTETTPEAAAEIRRVLAALGARRLVVGHTPSIEGIRALHGGRVIMIDTGASAAYGGVRAWLEIENGVVTAHGPGGAAPIGLEGDDH